MVRLRLTTNGGESQNSTTYPLALSLVEEFLSFFPQSVIALNRLASTYRGLGSPIFRAPRL
jgi:hypothetical protein